MRPNGRKLVGTLMLLTLVIVYVVLARDLALIVLPNAGAMIQFLYYAVAGLAWVPLAAWIISWMHRV